MKELQAAMRNLDLAIKLSQMDSNEQSIKDSIKVLILEAEELIAEAKKSIIGGGDDRVNAGS